MTDEEKALLAEFNRGLESRTDSVLGKIIGLRYSWLCLLLTHAAAFILGAKVF